MHATHASAGRGAAAGGAADGTSSQLMRGMHQGRRWRFVLDALMPPVSQLDSHNSVAVELDLDQLLGALWNSLRSNFHAVQDSVIRLIVCAVSLSVYCACRGFVA